MLNSQPAEKPSDSDELQVVSAFETIQGEGPYAGMPAVFIRLAGCNLQCDLCDTDYTSRRLTMSAEDLVNDVWKIRKGGLVVLTGGEPMRQKIATLIRRLLDRGYLVQVETNGTIFQADLPYGAFSIVCSPKTPKIASALSPYIDAWKYIIEFDHVSPIDGLPTRVLGVECKVARPKLNNLIYVQPLDEGDAERNAKHVKACLSSCYSFGYRLSLQLHKIIGLG